jgi:FtsP/CotA-like multicopper oxidase with cupredoxin domain
MNPIGKVIKVLLALTAAGFVALSLAGCEKSQTANAAGSAQAQAPKAAVAQQVQPTQPPDGRTVVAITVTEDGYVPSPIKLKKGEPVTLQITRKTDKTCATEIVLDEYGINTPLPLDQTVEVTFTPDKAGELKYGCAMGKMISAKFVVE